MCSVARTDYWKVLLKDMQTADRKEMNLDVRWVLHLEVLMVLLLVLYLAVQKAYMMVHRWAHQ
jgi:hypothetical protein